MAALSNSQAFVLLTHDWWYMPVLAGVSYLLGVGFGMLAERRHNS